MKGTIFCEFLNMVEENYDYNLVDTIISESKLSNDGAYTSVGTYNYEELVLLVQRLSIHTKVSIPNLLHDFGIYLFNVFLKKYPEMFINITDGFSFLQLINDKIHVEVRKLYPDAELPVIETELVENTLKMKYISSRKMGDLAKGLITGCMGYFDEKIELNEELTKQDGSEIVFTIKKL